ncbi:hypothetical protein EV356DRAFT_505832 [Viridothelium virens]|uniref:Uncharacterized protein n=1 Tax=Viridothelium virens TaxID=1048519 RepID=A0A6A6HKH0_VIRVR|nr:hypothetical protein EV356DRAFT_505832 [Viridothelium virens]
MALKCILCERYARRPLAEQLEREEVTPTIRSKDALKLVGNSVIVEKAIGQFERQVVHRAEGRPNVTLIFASLKLSEWARTIQKSFMDPIIEDDDIRRI